MMEYDVHTVLDLLTLLATCLVIYMLWFPLRDSYQASEDSMQSYFVVRPRYTLLWPLHTYLLAESVTGKCAALILQAGHRWFMWVLRTKYAAQDKHSWLLPDNLLAYTDTDNCSLPALSS